MQHIELLAPAKDLECGIAAVNCGADAVYIGASRFGARENAANSVSDIAELITHAHKYWARVYATVNTLLRDEEIPDALRLISQLYEQGIDGLIIQDTGLLECDLPPIPLIASTQMHNDTPEKVAFLEKAGFQRVILARELDLDQIREIRRQTSIELECFVHGALCVCYSGQCYLSYARGGRSGNRGECAQPCRKPYSLADGNDRVLVDNKHLLSIRDLNLSEHLRELIDAGVRSFKIEGRLKDKTYVTNIVSYYRQKLDDAMAGSELKRSSSGRSTIDFAPDPDKTFNRGYTTYFLNGPDSQVGAMDTPKMVGETIGKVVSARSGRVGIETDVPLHRGDGICFFDRHGDIRGTTVNSAGGNLIVPDKPDGLEPGTVVYRNHDHEFLTRLEKSRPRRRISVELALGETPEGLSLRALDEDGVAAEFLAPYEKTLADNPELALENIRKQLCKMGDSDYTCSALQVEAEQVYFIPISLLNALRRGVLEKLTGERARHRPAQTGGAITNDVPYPFKALSYLGNVLNEKAAAFYLRHGVISIEPAAESGQDMRGRKVMTTRFCIKHQLGICPRFGEKVSLEQEPLYLLDAEGHRLELRFDCRKCEMEVYLVER